MDPGLEQRTLAAEDRHWWYLGRRAIVLDAARRMLGGVERPAILDAGCGGGATIEAFAGLGSVTGLEPSPVSRERARTREAGEVIDAEIGAMPFAVESFDLALALDVIEHIDDDEAALADLHRVVKPHGSLVVTVPAHPRLWSRHDELNHHFRRYTRRGLARVAEETGWRVERITHFNAFMLPVAIVAHKVTRSDGLSVPPAPVNRVLEAVLHAERRLIAAGARLPLGLSLLAELRR